LNYTTPVFIFILASVSLVSLLSLVGISLLSLSHEVFHRLVSFLIAMAVGALFGDAFLHLLPEAYGREPAWTVGLWVLAGILGFFALENFLQWRHQHSDEEMEIQPFGYLSLLADSLHNFMDGLLIGASYLGGVTLGIATTMAVALHEIPHEFSDFGVLVQSGFTRGRALFLNFLTALAAVAGGLVAWWVGTASLDFTRALLPFAAGNFIYLAGSDLIPQLHRKTGPFRALFQIAGILLGAGIMLLLKLYE